MDAAAAPDRLKAWALDPLARRLSRGGQAVPLGERAFDLLLTLARAPGQVVSSQQLLARVWPGRVVEENNLHVQLAALRRVLGPEAIRTVRGQGYQLTQPMPVHEVPAAPAALMPHATPTPSAAPGNLTQRLPPLIGREAELARLAALLPQQRSVTVTGPAGVGKTSLAKAAAQALPQEGGAAWLVELAGVADGVPVPEVVARTLGLSLPGLQDPQDELIDLLRPRHLLLVLDNCEHRAREVARLCAALLQGTEGVRVLATSQAALQHPGEHLLRLQPLSLPAPGASAAEAGRCGAVALFCARLDQRSYNPTSPALAGDRSADVIAICAGLDGLPLALELAAARVPLLGLAGVRQRLGEQLKLLGGGRRDAPARQQTLRAAIQWSHALLDAPERVALRRLAVFAGGFDLALAQQVIADTAEEDADDWAALDLLQGLLDKSLLVQIEPTGSLAAAQAPRMRLLESTRSFALEQLRAAAELPRLQQRLAQALLRRFSRGDGPRAPDPSNDEAETRAADLGNLRAALDALSAAPDQASLLIDLTGASAWIWPRLGLRAEGLRRCRVALDRVAADTPPALEARLQLGWVTLAHRRGADGDTAAAIRAALLYQGLGDRLGRFRALSLLAFMRALEGDEPACNAALEDLANSFDPNWGLLQWGAYQWTLGSCLAQFDRWDELLALGDAIQPHRRAVGHVGWEGVALSGEAQVQACLGDHQAAVVHARAAVALMREHQIWGRLPTALGDLAAFLVELGQLDEALPLAREAAALRAVDGTLGLQLDQLARLACARGRYREAALVLGRADAHHARRNGRRDRYLQDPLRLARAAVAEALPAAEVAQLLARGATLGDDEVARMTLVD